MTSFMSKKKKYKFQVEICLEDLLAVPFVSAVLFAKLRLLDGGSFQDHSSRQEVKDHKVHWDAKFSFPCKMMANASTGVMEKCILRISIRKECKGGRSFTKLGFVDLNLAEYAGAGVIHKNALLEGYDTRHRQDNSMLKFSIQLNMMSGDILFKAPSPSLKHKQIPSSDDPLTDQRSDEFSSGSLAGSINSGSSGFGSLPKKRSQLVSTDFMIGQTLTESDTNNTIISSSAIAATIDPSGYSGTDSTLQSMHSDVSSMENTLTNHHYSGGGVGQELQSHSRNSSNTSQMSRASGYSSVSHSRQSSSGDSATGHIRNQLQHNSLKRPSNNSSSSGLLRAYTYPKHRINIPTTILSESPNTSTLMNQSNCSPEVFHTPQGSLSSPDYEFNNNINNNNSSSMDEMFHTPQCELTTPRKFTTTNNKRNVISRQNTSSTEDSEIFQTPVSSFSIETDVFSKNFNELQKSASSSVLENYRNNFFAVKHQLINHHDIENVDLRPKTDKFFEKNTKSDQYFSNNISKPATDCVLRSKSEFIIPKLSSPDPRRRDRSITNVIASFLTPRLQRKNIGIHSTPFKNNNHNSNNLKPLTNQESRAVSMGSLKLNNIDNSQQYLLTAGSIERMHRKILLDGSPLPKLATMISCSPPEGEAASDIIEYTSSPPPPPPPLLSQSDTQRRPSTIVMLNPSSCSLATSTSESGSLERAKAAYERRKKNTNALLDEGGNSGGGSSVSGRVEITRVNPEDFIAELLKSTNLEQPDDSAETSGLQLFIAKDGTAALGNHEVKSQMSTGVNTFKQVVMDDR